MAAGDTRTEHFLDVLAHGSRADIPQEECCNTKTQNYILGAINRIIDLEEEVDWLENNPDVADIVATYADLQNYDTSRLTDNAIIRVLADETHDGQSTYYRWNKTSDTWTYIGPMGDYYTKDQTDRLLAGKQDVLTFDQTPTANSDNPVTSGGIKSYVDLSPAFKPFPSTVVTDGTTQQFMNSILALDPEVGTTYLGTVSLSDMPGQLIQEEVEVYVYSDYVVYCIMRSTDVAPYAWWCASYNYQGWKSIDTTYTAGTNVSISSQNVISATDTTYTAGTGLGLTGTEFSVDTTTIQPKLTAGSNISIDANNEISATDTTYTAGANVNISAENVISATDTTYSDFTGTDGAAAGSAGLVPAPATTDAGKFLKADGTWDTAGSTYTAGDGINISAQDVISATNTGKMITLTSANYNYPADNPSSVALWLLDPGLYTWAQGFGANVRATRNHALNNRSSALVKLDGATAGVYDITVFGSSNSTGSGGNQAIWSYRVYISDGWAVGTPHSLSYDINDTLTSTSDYESLSANQGKVLKDLVDSIAIRGAGAPTTSTVGTVGQLYEDGTNGVLYQLKSIDITVTPNTYTWEEVGGASGPTVVQTTGTSTTDVMSQNAVTRMIFADPGTAHKVVIAGNTSTVGANAVSIGYTSRAIASSSVALGSGAHADAAGAIAMGLSANSNANNSVAIGNAADVNSSSNAVALGYGAKVTRNGEVNIGTGFAQGSGYNSSDYRVLGGLYDGQSAHDAATYGQLSTAIINGGTTAPTTATVGAVGTLYNYVDTTGSTPEPHLMVCTVADAVTPSYTWVDVLGSVATALATLNSGSGAA